MPFHFVWWKYHYNLQPATDSTHVFTCTIVSSSTNTKYPPLLLSVSSQPYTISTVLLTNMVASFRQSPQVPFVRCAEEVPLHMLCPVQIYHYDLQRATCHIHWHLMQPVSDKTLGLVRGHDSATFSQSLIAFTVSQRPSCFVRYCTVIFSQNPCTYLVQYRYHCNLKPPTYYINSHLMYNYSSVQAWPQSSTSLPKVRFCFLQ